MWARLVDDGIEVHRDSEERPPDALDVVERRPPYNPNTHNLAGPSFVLEGRRVVALFEAVPRDVEAEERVEVGRRVEAVRDKARAILANPAGAPDWTAAERKLILALVVLGR